MPHAAHTPTLDLVGSAAAAASAQVRAVASPLIHDPPWKPTTTVVVGIAFAALTIWIIALRGP
jgi:hypothetical protein